MATDDERVFVIHAWRNIERSGEMEVSEISRDDSYPDTLRDFMHNHPEFVSADIGVKALTEDKPAFLGTQHDGKLTAHVC